jgi:hypothetical protein
MHDLDVRTGAQAPEERRAGMSITVRGLPADHLLSHTWSTRAHLTGPHSS